MIRICKVKNLFIIGFVLAHLLVYQSIAQIIPKSFENIRESFGFKNIEMKDVKEFKIHSAEFLAISYFDPLPEGKKESTRFSVAILQNKNGKYIKLFEKVVCDLAAAHCFASPLLFESKENKFIVFEIFCGGQGSRHDLCIVRLSLGTATEIPVHDYYSNPLVKILLNQGEDTYCRGPAYGFERGVMTGTVDIWKEGDACCCPSTGEFLSFSYGFENGAFKIVEVKRHKHKTP